MSEPTQPERPRRLRVRRAPRYGPFLATGAVVGALVGLVAALVGPVGADHTRMAVVGYLVAGLGLLGGLLGGLVAVVLERRSARGDVGH